MIARINSLYISVLMRIANQDFKGKVQEFWKIQWPQFLLRICFLNVSEAFIKANPKVFGVIFPRVRSIVKG